MQVNLKKAAALAAALGSVVIPVPTSYVVDIYGEIPSNDAVDKAHEIFKVQVDNTLAVVSAQFAIRHLVGKANEGRINELLTAGKMCEKQLERLNKIPNRDVGTNLDVLQRKVEAARAKEANQFGGPRVDPLEIETASVLTPHIKALKKQKRLIDEQLQALNFTTIIELPDDVVKVLTGLDLV